MSTVEVIANKISYIQKHLTLARKYQQYSLAHFLEDVTIKSAVERELYIIAQAVIDLAEAVVAFKKFRKPTTMREALQILGEEKILPQKFLVDFIKIVGFRNALAHDYEDLRFEVVYEVLQKKLSQVIIFLRHIKKALKI